MRSKVGVILLLVAGMVKTVCAVDLTLDDNAVWASSNGDTVIVMRDGFPTVSSFAKVFEPEIQAWKDAVAAASGLDSSTTVTESHYITEDASQSSLHTTVTASNSAITISARIENIRWKQRVWREQWEHGRGGSASYRIDIPVIGYYDEVDLGDWEQVIHLNPNGTATYTWTDSGAVIESATLNLVGLGSGFSPEDAIDPVNGYSMSDVRFLLNLHYPDQEFVDKYTYIDPPYAYGFNYRLDAGRPERIVKIDLPSGFGSQMEILTPSTDGGALVSRGFFGPGKYDLKQLSGRSEGVKQFTVQSLSSPADLGQPRPFVIGMIFEDAVNATVQVTMRPLAGDATESIGASGRRTIRLTNNTIQDVDPQISGSNVIWAGYYDDGRGDIFLWDGVASTLVANISDMVDEPPQLSGSNAVWQNVDDHYQMQLFFWNGDTVTQITNADNEQYFYEPRISGGNVVWCTWDGNDDEIFFWNGTTITQVTNNNYDDFRPRISGNNVAWSTWDGNDQEIFFWDGDTITRVTDNDYSCFEIQISGNNIVWVGSPRDDIAYPDGEEIFFWDGATVKQVTNNNYGDTRPQISGNNVVWIGWDGNDEEVFFWDGVTTTQLTNNNYNDSWSQISGNNVVWAGYDGNDDEIFFWDGVTTTQLTNNDYGDNNPRISGSRVVWEGHNWVWDWPEIFVSVPFSEISISKCTAKAGRSDGKDRIKISGSADIAEDVLYNADKIHISITSDADGYLVYDEYLNIDHSKVKRGKYSHKDKQKGIAFKLDTMKDKFTLKCKNVDLTGLGCPLSLAIQAGSYLGEGLADESVVNGKKPIPLALMMGHKDTLQISKPKIKVGKKASTDSISFKGTFTVRNDLSDIVVTLGDQSFTIPIGSFYPKKNTLVAKNVPLPGGGFATAKFYFSKATFRMKLKKLAIEPKGRNDLSMSSGNNTSNSLSVDVPERKGQKGGAGSGGWYVELRAVMSRFGSGPECRINGNIVETASYFGTQTTYNSWNDGRKKYPSGTRLEISVDSGFLGLNSVVTIWRSQTESTTFFLSDVSMIYDLNQEKWVPTGPTTNYFEVLIP